MGDPLSAGDELIAGIVAECVAHPAVASADACAALDGGHDRALLLLRELAAGPYRDDQTQFAQFLDVVEAAQRIGNVDLEALFLEHALKDCRDFFGLMPIPSAPDDQCALGHDDFPPAKLFSLDRVSALVVSHDAMLAGAGGEVDGVLVKSVDFRQIDLINRAAGVIVDDALRDRFGRILPGDMPDASLRRDRRFLCEQSAAGADADPREHNPDVLSHDAPESKDEV
jgi:hypothetical protein